MKQGLVEEELFGNKVRFSIITNCFISAFPLESFKGNSKRPNKEKNRLYLGKDSIIGLFLRRLLVTMQRLRFKAKSQQLPNFFFPPSKVKSRFQFLICRTMTEHMYTYQEARNDFASIAFSKIQTFQIIFVLVFLGVMGRKV